MKRIVVIVAAVGAALFILFTKTPFIRPSGVSTEITTNATPSVSVTLNTGSAVATISGITAHNAFQALSEAAKQQKLEVKTKQYDFGVFVEQIGQLANTKEKSWIYFVNGTSGTVAADKQNLNTGDTVEWKYMTPTIE